MPAVQLLGNDAIPRRATRTGGARHTEHRSAVAESGEGTRLDRGGAYFLKGQLPEQFPKAVDRCIEQRRHGNYRVVAPGETGTTGEQNRMYSVIGYQRRDQCAQLVHVILADVFRAADMPGTLQGIAQKLARGIRFLAARIRYRHHGNVQRNEVLLRFVASHCSCLPL